MLVAETPGRADDIDGDGVDDWSDVCDNTPAGTAVDFRGRSLGDSDLEDYALSQQGFIGPLGQPVAACCSPRGTCVLGPAGGLPLPRCNCFDLDGDDDVDPFDVRKFQSAFTGR